MGVVAIAPHRALAGQDAIHGQRHSDGEPAGAGAQRAVVIGFDDGVQVVRLDGERDDSEATVRSAPDGREDRSEDTRIP